MYKERECVEPMAQGLAHTQPSECCLSITLPTTIVATLPQWGRCWGSRSPGGGHRKAPRGVGLSGEDEDAASTLPPHSLNTS